MNNKKFFNGLALGALLGGALGLFFSPDKGKANREKFKKVSKQLSEKLVAEAGKVGKLSKGQYEAVVENIIKKYSKNDLLEPETWAEIGNELKLRWKDIQKEMKKK